MGTYLHVYIESKKEISKEEGEKFLNNLVAQGSTFIGDWDLKKEENILCSFGKAIKNYQENVTYIFNFKYEGVAFYISLKEKQVFLGVNSFFIHNDEKTKKIAYEIVSKIKTLAEKYFGIKSINEVIE